MVKSGDVRPNSKRAHELCQRIKAAGYVRDWNVRTKRWRVYKEGQGSTQVRVMVAPSGYVRFGASVGDSQGMPQRLFDRLFPEVPVGEAIGKANLRELGGLGRT